MNDPKNFETLAIRTQSERSQHNEHSTPVFMTSSFMFDDAEHARALFSNEVDGNIYTRYSNPNNDEFITKLKLMEGADDGIATASGMAAVFTTFAGLLSSGDHILACRSVFGSTHQVLTQILPRWGITHTYVDIDKPETWEAEIRPETRMIIAETPSNPALDLIDLEWLGQLSKKHDLILAIDNCFATPYIQTPIQYGCNIVIHSATKFIDGQGRCIAGAVVGDADLIEKLRFFARQTGPALSPMNSWILSKSLETLAVRMDRHCSNAMALAKHFQNNEHVLKVSYPFLETHPQYAIAKKQMRLGGGLFTMELKGGLEQGRRFLDSLKMLSFTANLGDTRTIVAHPASTTHSKLTPEELAAVRISPGLVRISAGLEHVDDIIADIEQALEASK